MFDIKLIDKGYCATKQFKTIGDINVKLSVGGTNETWKVPHERMATVDLTDENISITGGEEFCKEIYQKALIISGTNDAGTWNLNIVKNIALDYIFKWFKDNPEQFLNYIEQERNGSMKTGRAILQSEIKHLLDLDY